MNLTSRSTLLGLLTLIEILVLILVLARWFGNTKGWRTSGGRLIDYVATTAADLGRPVRQTAQFINGARTISLHLSDPQLTTTLNNAAASVRGEATSEQAFAPYAATFSSRTISVAALTPTASRPHEPWSADDGWWSARRVSLQQTTVRADSSCYVGIGARRRALVLIDLDQAPGVLEIVGDSRQSFSLICALAAQLFVNTSNAAADGEVMIASGVHAQFNGRPLSDLLEELETRAQRARTKRGRTTLVCGSLTTQDSARVVALHQDWPSLRVITAGPFPGTRWQLPVSASGRVTAPELGLTCDSAPLERGVARALAGSAGRTGHAPPPSAPMTSSGVTSELSLDEPEDAVPNRDSQSSVAHS